MSEEKDARNSQDYCGRQSDIAEVAAMLSELPRDVFEHLSARIRMAHEMRGRQSILARLLLAKPASNPRYAEFEERLREVGERMRRSGDP